MGDLINNFEIFKKLGFDSANQYILYDDRFQRFFKFFAENITDANILTEHEVLERDELLRRKEYLEPSERNAQLRQLERDNPGLLEYTEAQGMALTQDILFMEQTEEVYMTLIEDMRCTKNKINYRLGNLENKVSVLVNSEKELIAACQSKTKKLEELQRDNLKLSNEATRCFTNMQSPPLFVHQLPLEQYFLKCDSFIQYFTLFMKENFKIQEGGELNDSNGDLYQLSECMEGLAKSIDNHTIEYIKEKSKAKATQALIDLLDLTQIHIISLADMARETHELELVNEHHLKVGYDTLINDLMMHVQQLTQQRMELILYENTKLKLERALKRHDKDKHLSKIISDALSNAELIWITIQLDLEKVRNRFVGTESLNSEIDACLRRIKSMHNVGSTQSGNCCLLIKSIAEKLSQHLGQRVVCEPKACLYEYEKFSRLLSYSIHGMINKKAYAFTLDRLNELNYVEEVLKPLIDDSPVEAPMFEHIRFLLPIYKAKMKHVCIDKVLRNLRTQYTENVADRMQNDKFWRYNQLLWIWFLTEPRRVIMAIEEVKKAASKASSHGGVKALSGIKRK